MASTARQSRAVFPILATVLVAQILHEIDSGIPQHVTHLPASARHEGEVTEVNPFGALRAIMAVVQSDLLMLRPDKSSNSDNVPAHARPVSEAALPMRLGGLHDGST